MSIDPAAYHAWYATPRGAWMGEQERRLMLELLALPPGAPVLDSGCGTGFFSSALADAGLAVTGLDPDGAALAFLARRDPRPRLVQGRAETLPFAHGTFAGAVAMTSLCFCADPALALGELWRVSERVLLGLLHRHSLLCRIKAGSRGYLGARWDSLNDLRAWTRGLTPAPVIRARSALLLPGAGSVARWIEPRLAPRVPFGGFLAVVLDRPGSDRFGGR